MLVLTRMFLHAKTNPHLAIAAQGTVSKLEKISACKSGLSEGSDSSRMRFSNPSQNYLADFKPVGKSGSL